MTRLLALTFILLFSNNVFSQLIRTEPAFPRADEPVTVFFDASEGTGGLENCSCTVRRRRGQKI